MNSAAIPYPIKFLQVFYYGTMSRTTIDIDEGLIRRAQRLTGLKTKRAIVNRALEVLVRTEGRKGILRYFGSGIWKGDLKALRRNRRF